MPVTINVSQVCDALYFADSPEAVRGPGAPSTTILGQWFHEGIRRLVSAGTEPPLLRVLAEVEPDLALWKKTLTETIYANFVGPQLTRQQAALSGMTPQVLSFWQAMQSACDWIAELTWTIQNQKVSHRHPIRAPWQTLSDWFSTEESLTCTFSEPGWTDSVCLVGIADAVVRLAASGNWCAIELKLGRTSPAIDLGQACLYHLMLTAAEQARQKETPFARPVQDVGTLALVSFHPERHEQLYTAAQLADSRSKLINLIGAVAGVNSRSTPAGIDDPPTIPMPPPGTVPPNPFAGQTPVSPLSRESNTARASNTAANPYADLSKSILRTFQSYGVDVTLSESIDVGPSFLRFRVQLGRGTKVSAVKSRAAELQVVLSLKAEPFIATNDEGKLVIDVQRPDRQKVLYETIRPQLVNGPSTAGGSRVPVGIDLSGQLICADLSKPEHSHLLVAGTTGSGKSEWLRVAIAGLMETNTPDTLRLLIIDPKRNAFHALRQSPYLWRPIIFPDEHSAVDALAELAEEMDRRYRICDGADSFAQMVSKSESPLPRIVCVCDEYRDLISRDRKERKLIEAQICRLGAKARAAGIHLILATQEPSRDTIKGPLDSNIPARVGLKMGKRLESTMLFGEKGAENLLGNGDLLFKDIGSPRRLQGPLLSDELRDEIFARGLKPNSMN